MPKGNLAKHLLTDWALISHACLYKKEIVNKIGGFREDFFGTEDTLFLFDCILAGAKFSFTNKTCILYRTNNIKLSKDTDIPDKIIESVKDQIISEISSIC